MRAFIKSYYWGLFTPLCDEFGRAHAPTFTPYQSLATQHDHDHRHHKQQKQQHHNESAMNQYVPLPPSICDAVRIFKFD